MGNDIPIPPKAINMEINSIEAEFQDLVNRDAWPIIYQRIGLKCQLFPYTYIEARKPQNRPLNRYRDVNPYDHSRVVLKRCERDYINANYVNLERAGRRYILTQGPLPSTVGHFWLMVWEQNSQAILMLNKVIEKNEMKCHWYWPQAVGEEHKIVLNDVNLSVEQIKEEDCCYYSTRIFRLVDLETSTVRHVVQYHYTTWPDFGVPTSPVAFLTFLKRVRQSGVLDTEAGPPIIHCSAGIGRSGTFCLVDSCLVIIEKEGVDDIDIQEVLVDLRRDRMGLIQTPDQLRFSYQAIIEGIKRLDPNFKEEEEELPKVEPPKMNNEIFANVAEEEQAPPSPPPRTESLAGPPVRPLPAIPTSESLGDLFLSPTEDADSSSDAESVANLICMCPSSSEDENEEEDPKEDEDEGSAISVNESPLKKSAKAVGNAETVENAENEETAANAETTENLNALRKRRVRELSERIVEIKKRIHKKEKWHAFKRFLYKPVTITCGVIIAGIVIYAYVYVKS